jgi:hypothetical protein
MSITNQFYQYEWIPCIENGPSQTQCRSHVGEDNPDKHAIGEMQEEIYAFIYVVLCLMIEKCREEQQGNAER